MRCGNGPLNLALAASTPLKLATAASHTRVSDQGDAGIQAVQLSQPPGSLAAEWDGPRASPHCDLRPDAHVARIGAIRGLRRVIHSLAESVAAPSGSGRHAPSHEPT